jgi:hypothetical protein
VESDPDATAAESEEDGQEQGDANTRPTHDLDADGPARDATSVPAPESDGARSLARTGDGGGPDAGSLGGAQDAAAEPEAAAAPEIRPTQCPEHAADNACGGPCTVTLAHSPGETCSNGLTGACAREGTYVCAGTTATVCNAPSAQAGVEICRDGLDNDCDGAADEPDAADATLWYPDCDGDGFASSVGVRACVKPTTCAAYFTTAPVPAVSEDCDDASAVYKPGSLVYRVPPAGKTSHDFNCDGIVEKLAAVAAPKPNPSSPLGPLGLLAFTCSAGATCGECFASRPCPEAEVGPCYPGQYATQWTNALGTTVVPAPPCSTSVDDKRPYRAANADDCPGPASQPAWGDPSPNGLQLCR